MNAGCIAGTKTFSRQIPNGIRLFSCSACLLFFFFSVLFVYIIGSYLEQQQGDDYSKLELTPTKRIVPFRRERDNGSKHPFQRIEFLSYGRYFLIGI
jgi:hypothetical protein